MVARHALVGHDIPEDPVFEFAEFQVGGLSELATVRPLTNITFPITPHTEVPFSAHWNPESEQRWSSADGDEITLTFVRSVDYRDHYGMLVTTVPIVRVQGRGRTVRQWLDEFVVPLAELTTLATIRAQPVSWLQVGTASQDHDRTLVFGGEIEQSPYEASHPGAEHPRISDVHLSLVLLGPRGVDLAEVLARWRQLRTQHRPLHDYLVLDRTHPELGERERLMRAVPALEALHDGLYGKPPPGPSTKRRAKILKALGALAEVSDDVSELTAEDVKFAKKNLKDPNGTYELHQRLEALVEKNLDAGLRELITQRTMPWPADLILEATSERDPWAVMGIVRNRLAHGNPKVPTNPQITATLHLAHTLAVGLTLDLLGVSDTVLRASIAEDWWKVLR